MVSAKFLVGLSKRDDVFTGSCRLRLRAPIRWTGRLVLLFPSVKREAGKRKEKENGLSFRFACVLW